jgi:hypothetical protein
MKVLNSFYLTTEDVADMFQRYLADIGIADLENEVEYSEFEKTFQEWLGNMEANELILWSPREQCYYVKKGEFEI